MEPRRRGDPGRARPVQQRAHGFAPLGPATGNVKRQILGLNAARLYDVDVTAPRGALPQPSGAALGALKAEYAAQGAAPSNIRHGWIRES